MILCETWTFRSLPFPGNVFFSARWTWWMGVSSGLVSTMSMLELLSCSTRAGRQGPFRASSNFLTNLKRVLGVRIRAEHFWWQSNHLTHLSGHWVLQNKSTNQISYRWVFSTDCLMDQKLTSFHLEILTKSWRQQFTSEWSFSMCMQCISLTCTVGQYCYAIEKDTDINLQLLLNGLSELTDSGLDAVRKLTVVFVQVPQKTGQWLCKIRRKVNITSI